MNFEANLRLKEVLTRHYSSVIIHSNITMTHKETHESIFITLGRLKTAIQYGKKSRALELLEKVSNDTAQMDIDLMHYQYNVEQTNRKVFIDII